MVSQLPIIDCLCNLSGTVNKTNTCTDSGQCNCMDNFEGLTCDHCKDGYFGTSCEGITFNSF